MFFEAQKELYMITFSHLGARNSFTVKPISPYDTGETQNPHRNQDGIYATMEKQLNLFSEQNSPLKR